MKTLFALAAAITLVAAPSAYAADAAVEAPIRAMIDGFNKGDIAAVKAAHVASPTILDEVAAPFAWEGPTAFDDWLATMGKTESARGRTDGKVAIGAITRETVEGDTAYVIAPSTYTFKQKGVTMRETGTLTWVLVKESAGWKIRSWAWTSPEAKAVR
jgi:ketosteroid isomerase-like protein